jgi:3'(2'), 5'-bisphosphate nucleotidase
MAAAVDQTEILLRQFEELALAAGRLILELRARGIAARAKPDRSPVTEADLRAEQLICAGLALKAPDLAVVAEESAAQGRVPADLPRQFVLIDPLDGTREFLAGRDEFTVNIGLVRDGTPVAGVVFAPAIGLLYSGRPGLAERTSIDAAGEICERVPIRASARRQERLRILASRSHRTPATDSYLRQFPDAEILAIGSSLKFCLLAEGSADLYPRFGPTMEWDTAAGDAILRAAGGMTRTVDGEPLTYGKRAVLGGPERDYCNPDFIAHGAAQASPAS